MVMMVVVVVVVMMMMMMMLMVFFILEHAWSLCSSLADGLLAVGTIGAEREWKKHVNALHWYLFCSGGSTNDVFALGVDEINARLIGGDDKHARVRSVRIELAEEAGGLHLHLGILDDDLVEDSGIGARADGPELSVLVLPRVAVLRGIRGTRHVRSNLCGVLREDEARDDGTEGEFGADLAVKERLDVSVLVWLLKEGRHVAREPVHDQARLQKLLLGDAVVLILCRPDCAVRQLNTRHYGSCK